MLDLSLTSDDLLSLDDAALDRIYKLARDPREESLRKYCPHKPWPKQQEFIDLTCREALFGGSAGSAKTDCLLMCALQWVHVPGYACLIIRRDFARLSKAGSIMDRLKAWLRGTDAKWNDQQKRATFPSGAIIEFGYIDHPDDRFQFQSTEYQQVILDEITELRLSNDESNPYLFMFSRQRREIGFRVPIMIRAASNPGQIGHRFVKERFVPKDYDCEQYRQNQTGPIYTDNGNRAFLPGFIEDNPSLDPVEYEASLSHLPPITRARLLRGDWSITEDGLIEASWVKRFHVSPDGTITIYNQDGSELARWNESESYRFATCDPAGTSADKAKTSRGHDHSWSVVQVWDRSPASVGQFIVLRHCSRVRVSFTGLLDTLRGVCEEWQPSRVRIENEKLGQAAQEMLRDEIPIDTVPTGGKDKVSRASVLLQKLERGEVALPQQASWLEALESEWFAWTGHPDETSDQVDAAAYAAMESQGKGFGIWPAELFSPLVWCDAYPRAKHVVACVMPTELDDTGMGGNSAIVYCGVCGDGRVYVDAVLSEAGLPILVDSLRSLEGSFGQPVASIVTTPESIEIVQEAIIRQYASHTLNPTLYAADLKACEFAKPEALTPIVTDRVLRFLRGSAGCRALVNRMKAYPHTKDAAAIIGLGLAIETLANWSGGDEPR